MKTFETFRIVVLENRGNQEHRIFDTPDRHITILDAKLTPSLCGLVYVQGTAICRKYVGFDEFEPPEYEFVEVQTKGLERFVRKLFGFSLTKHVAKEILWKKFEYQIDCYYPESAVYKAIK